MNWLVFHVASGQSFFSGAALITLAVVLSTAKKRGVRRISTLSFLIGLISVVISSTAIPYWFYAVVAAITLVWIGSVVVGRWRWWPSAAAVVGWLTCAAVELPYHALPALPPVDSAAVTIIGDSLTAGMGENEAETWPNLLAREHDISVHDYSHVGETAASALNRIRPHDIESPIVILEIGGNDLLGSTSSKQFALDLSALLEHVCVPGVQVAMFELPLPPLCHEYGQIQRTLARRHDVKLIPKRVLLGVLGESGSTLDSIHLTQAGHQRMSDRVWQLLESALDPNVHSSR